MANYSFKARLTEWSTWLGILISVLGVAIPHFVTLTAWTTYLQDALVGIGAIMAALPQTAGTQMVEKEVWALLQALSTTLPQEYVPALKPIIAELGTMTAKTQAVPVVPADVVPADKPMQAPPAS